LFKDDIVFASVFVEIEPVLIPRAAATHHGDSQRVLGQTLFGHGVFDHLDGLGCENYHPLVAGWGWRTLAMQVFARLVTVFSMVHGHYYLVEEV
jgi:hypothetical protein